MRKLAETLYKRMLVSQHGWVSRCSLERWRSVDCQGEESENAMERAKRVEGGRIARALFL